MADMRPFDYLCRICASDTKGKKSVAECVFVLKTAALKEKIQKYLDLKVSEDDALPKVICKSCYRSVEGIVSLSKIAIHTQMVLSNFLKPHAALIEPDAEFTSFSLSCKDYASERSSSNVSVPEPVISHSQQSLPKQQPEEVVVNVSVSDPLTRETQQKIIGATRQRQNVMDARFIPKSIATRHVSFAADTPLKEMRPQEPTNLTIGQKTSPMSVINYFNPSQQQQQQQQQQQHQQPKQQHVTVTSGGYVIGQFETPQKAPPPPSAPQLSSVPGPAIVTAPLKPAAPVPVPTQPTPPNILQTSPNNKARNSSENEKKRNKVTIKNTRPGNTLNTGQVSLLKVSQKSSPIQQQNTPRHQATKIPSLNSSRLEISVEAQQRGRAMSPTLGRKSRRPPPQRRPTIAEIPSSAEALPKEIIIASVKKPKQSHTGERKTRSNVDEAEPDTQKSLFPDDIPLGRVIKDFDLLKLIMKALKWPVNKDNMETQMTRLRNSKFTTIMSDHNLLQDTDLTQLLGPYLAPVLLAAQALQQQQQQQQSPKQPQQQLQQQPQQQQQQQQHHQKQQISTPMSCDLPTDLTSVGSATNLASAIPYRLPPETSVQLVPASPEEERQMNSPPHSSRIVSTISPKKGRHRTTESKASSRDNSIVISDGEDDPASNSGNIRRKFEKFKSKAVFDTDSMRSIQSTSIDRNPDITLNPSIYELSKSYSSHRKQTTVDRKTAGSNSLLYPNFVDDIVLIEPEDQPKAQSVSSSPTKDLLRKKPAATAAQSSVISLSSTKSIFSARVMPPITRPIIKRRKTVIHASPSKMNPPNISSKLPEPTPVREVTPVEKPLEKIQPKEVPMEAAVDNQQTNSKESLLRPKPKETLQTASILEQEPKLEKSNQSLPLLTAIEIPTNNSKTASDSPVDNVISTEAKPLTTSLRPPTSTLTSSITESTTPATKPPKEPVITTTATPSPPSTSSLSNVLTTSSLKTELATNTLASNKISVSTSMSFFGAVSAHTAAEKEVAPKKTASSSKAALAEQLLEAVGLKKSNILATQKSASKDIIVNSRESVQQIRSALKRSLKQAVEQNLRKLEEQPVIKQVADSTTKIAIKESTHPHQSSSSHKPLASNDIKSEIDGIVSEHQKSEKPISLLKSKSALPSEANNDRIQISQEAVKQRLAGRPRKTSTQTSVIKKPVNESKSVIETQQEEHKIAYSGTLTELSNTGNTVTSTSEIPPSGEASQLVRKRGRKRKVEEGVVGDSVENLDFEFKKELKEEFDPETMVVGDGELIKETGHDEDTDKRLDTGSSSSRPSRASKIQSKYFKGPNRQASTRSTRSTRNKQ